VEITTSPVYAAALNYARHGWAVIPVHGLMASLPEKRCTCNRFPCGPGNANAGKHPVRGGWTTGPPMSAADIYAAWVEEGPDWNVGIRTGEASGFFVVDVDPKAGGHHELTRLERYNGQLPVTRTVRTGSMGRHFYFRMPDFAIRNNARKLADGIDIRGTGGMVVAPPSVSGIGPYDLITDAPIVTAPAWLLDLLRLPEGFDPGETVVVEDLPAYLDLDADTQHRVSRYALSVLEAEARTYAEAPPGTGNAQLFRSTCNMLEIVQSPWNQLTADDVVRMLDRAREQRTVMRPDGGQGPDEFRKTVQSARSKVVGTGRQLPPEPANGVLFDSGISVPLAGPVVGADMTTGTPVTGTDAPALSLLDRMRAELLTADQVATRPNPRPLVNGLLDLDSEAWLIGKPGSFKSFVALDLAGHVGTGKPWHNRRVHQGTVIYIVAEGASGTTLRVRAWQAEHGPMDNVLFLPRPVQVRNAPAWEALVALCRELEPALVIIDTQARVTVGMKENDATDMGVYVEAVRQLREATTACVLTIHHIGRNGQDARGSNAIDGAQGTELRLNRPEGVELAVELHMDKQKDMADAGVLDIALKRWDGGTDPETGRDLSSLVAVESSPFDQPAVVRKPWIDDLTENQRKIVDVLFEHVDADGDTFAGIYRLVRERFGEMTKASFQTAFNALKGKTIITQGVTSTRWTLTSKADGDSP
jgi:hypothetical protein